MQSAQSADPYYGSLWGLDNTGQRLYVPGSSGYYNAGTADADMDVPEAWTKATGAGVTVGDRRHGRADVASRPRRPARDQRRARSAPTRSSRDKRSNDVDDDGNGYSDDWQGWDFVSAYPSIGVSEGDGTAGPDNDPQDNHGHGTHVAGTVAAQRDNNEGIAGVAPGARIMPLRALGANGRGSSIAIAEAFDYAGKMGVRVVNASLGGPGLDQSQLAAIQAHPNTLYVIAAGNDNVNVDATPYGPCALPAANILCVGASDVNDREGRRSPTTARTSVDVFAPGTAILSTYTSSAYAYLQGTSMASPNAAGVAALVLSARPGAERARHQERDHGLDRRQARPERQVGHRRARQRRPRGHRRARRRAGERHAARRSRGRRGRASRWARRRAPGTRPGPRTPTSGSGRSTAARPGRRSSARPPRPTRRARRTSARACASRSPPPTRTAWRARPRRRSAPSLSGAPVNTAAPVISGTPRRGQVLTVGVGRGARPARPTRTSGSARPTASPGRTIGTSADELHAHDGRARARACA